MTRESAEYAFGDECQRAWALMLPHDGYAVFPFYLAEHNVDPTIGAPLYLMPNGQRAVAPDLFIAGVNRTAQLHEVKGKATPSWRFSPWPGRWEHGMDWASAQDYRKVQQVTGLPIVIAVFETGSPVDVDRESALGEQFCWLTIPLDRAFEWGEHRLDWPGGKRQPWRRGKAGQGGLLWPRAAMNLYLGVDDPRKQTIGSPVQLGWWR